MASFVQDTSINVTMILLADVSLDLFQKFCVEGLAGSGSFPKRIRVRTRLKEQVHKSYQNPFSQIAGLWCLLKHEGDDIRRNSKLNFVQARNEPLLSRVPQLFTAKLVPKNPKLGPLKNMFWILHFFLGGDIVIIVTDCADNILHVQPIDQVSEHLWIVFWQLEFLVLRLLEAILESSLEVWNTVT